MKLLESIMPALCWPFNDDAESLYAFANVYPGVQNEMFQNNRGGQEYVEEQYNPQYSADNQGNRTNSYCL